jgi:hypothetical protein
MRTLVQNLQDLDSGYLKIISELWGVDPPEGEIREDPEALAHFMLDPRTLEEVLEALPAEAQECVDYLTDHNGRVPYADLSRRFGSIREMGSGRRDREKPWRSPQSSTEVLWYHGLIGRAFIDTSTGPQEYAFIPDDLRIILPQSEDVDDQPLGMPLSDPDIIHESSYAIIDDAVTLLAAFRNKSAHDLPTASERGRELHPLLQLPDAVELVIELLQDCGLLGSNPITPAPEPVGNFLETTRQEARTLFLLSWKNSTNWNDLSAVPGLYSSTEDWPNDPLLSRQSMLDLLQPLEVGKWWRIDDFIQSVKETQPGFQRPGGDFSSWYLQDSDKNFLTDFEHWDSVEGAYIRHMITGPLHWLGIFDLGQDRNKMEVHAFRKTRVIVESQPAPEEVSELDEKVSIRADGLIIAPIGTARDERYQIARFSSWEKMDGVNYEYRLTPEALDNSLSQGLKPDHVRIILERSSQAPLPPSIDAALKRWSDFGTEARFEQLLVVRFKDEEIIERLHANKTAARFIQERIGSEIIVVREVNWMRLRDAAARLGILIAPPED